MNKTKTVLFVMPRLPFPASSGRKTSLYHYCRILSKELGYRLIVAAFLENGDDPSKKPGFIDELIILPKPNAIKKMNSIFINSFILKKLPMQVALYWNPKAKKIIDEIYAKEKPEIVIGDMVRSTEYIRKYDTFTIADLDDRISLRYQRQLENDIDGINPYGAFLDTVPRLLRKLLLIKSVKLSVVKNEIKLLNKYELEIGAVCNATVFVAQKEADEFNNELGIKKAFAVPIGVDTDYFSYRKCGIDGNVIGFLGALNVAHNENAVRHFIIDIFPDIIKKVPDTKFLVIGGGASAELLALQNKNIIFTGRVDDVREFLERCKIFVCPMTFGSGIKTKNLEAMAMGLPVVTTTVGAENISARNNYEWKVADSEKFADNVIDLIKDNELCLTMGKKGSEFVSKNYTWYITKECLSSLLEGLQKQ